MTSPTETPATMTTATMTTDEIRAAVQDRYAAAARASLGLLDGSTESARGCCATSCCGETPDDRGGAHSGTTDAITRDLYQADAAETSAAALRASLGCGNPTMLADLRPGDTVLDLGSGGGLDVLLSARRVGPDGTAYGLDMTPEMLELARRNQSEAGITNAEFLQGTIEEVPLGDATVDVVISNCVINLSADKDAVLREAFRVLRPGGRFAVSDIVLTRPLPDDAMHVVGLWTGCVAGALLDSDYLAKLGDAGFTDASIEVTRSYQRRDIEDLADQLRPEDLPAGVEATRLVDLMEGAFASAFVRAGKPQ